MAASASALQPLLTYLAGLEARIASLEGGAPMAAAAPAASPAASAGDELSRQTQAFDAFLAGAPAALAAVSTKIGGDCALLGDALGRMFAFNRRLVQLAASHKKPTAEAVKVLAGELVGLGAPIKDVEKNFKSAFVNHAKAAHESVAAFQWVLADNGGLGLVEAARESADFWANKVRKESKEKSTPDWMAWANALRDALAGLYEFVKEHYKTGVTYNGKGGEFPTSAAAAPAPAPAAAAPAAPAAAPASAPTSAAPATPAGAAPRPNLSGLFSQISLIDQSSGRTAGLKHVDKKAVAAEKAASAPLAAPTPKAAAAAAAPAARRGEGVVPTGEAKVECENGVRWKIDFVSNNKATPLHLADVTTKQDLYIFACQNAVIYVDAKCKGVRLDSCRDLTLFVDSALSGVEVVNSRKIKVQIVKSVPSIAIDKTDGILIGLSHASRGAQFVTSKSSEMNVTFPVSEAADADWIEQPIPEQFVSVIRPDGKLSTGVSELYSH